MHRRPRRLGSTPPQPSDTYAQLRHSLTRNEQVVADLFLKLLDDKRIARILDKRPQTIHNNIASILRKVKVSSRVELVYFACTGHRAQQLAENQTSDRTRLK